MLLSDEECRLAQRLAVVLCHDIDVLEQIAGVETSIEGLRKSIIRAKNKKDEMLLKPEVLASRYENLIRLMSWAEQGLIKSTPLTESAENQLPQT